jgi:predicted neutral ceramidase superfamily lipid hydrolase
MYANGKMISIETIPGIKENVGGGEFKYDIFVRTSVNATMYPHSAQQ